jgi:hypothetical protein
MANEQDNYKINFDTNAKKAAQDTNELAKGLDNVDDSTQKVVNSNKSLRAQMKEATVELIQAQNKFGDYSKEALSAAKNLAELRDKIAEASETANLFDPGKKFQVVAGAISAMASGFAVAQGAMGLFGAESEEVEKALLKVQSAMALSQGLSTIADSAKDFQRLKAIVVDAMKSIATAKAIDTVATETNTVAQGANAVAVTADTAVKGGATIATTALTVATNILNASLAVLTAPIFLAVAAIAGLVAGIGYLSGAFGDFSGESEKASNTTKALEKELDKESQTLAKTGRAVREKNEHTLAMAKANGQSSDSIRKLESKLIDEQIAVDKASVMTARNTFIQERNNLAKLKASDASDEVIKAREKEVQVAWDTFQRENKQLDTSYKERAELKKTHLVEVAKEETDAENKLAEERKKANEKRLEEQKEANKKALEEQKKQKEKEASLVKEGLDYESNLKKQLEDLSDETEEEKLNRMRSRAEQEIEALKQKGINTEEITRLNAEKFDELEAELAEKRAEEDLDRQAKKGLEEISLAASNADKVIADEKALEDAKQGVRQAGVSNAESIGKSMQALAGKNKAVAKAGLIVEGAVGLANIVSNTMQANAKSIAAFPTTGGMPFVAINTVAGALSAAAQIKAVTTGLKALGGGSAPSAPSMGGGGGGGAPTAAPTVAFNNTAENQIGQSIARTQADQPALRVNVLESDITKAQTNVIKLKENNTF